MGGEAAVEKIGVAEPGPWLCCWAAGVMQEPTTAWSAAGSGGGGKNAPSAKVNPGVCWRTVVLVGC